MKRVLQQRFKSIDNFVALHSRFWNLDMFMNTHMVAEPRFEIQSLTLDSNCWTPFWSCQEAWNECSLVQISHLMSSQYTMSINQDGSMILHSLETKQNLKTGMENLFLHWYWQYSLSTHACCTVILILYSLSIHACGYKCWLAIYYIMYLCTCIKIPILKWSCHCRFRGASQKRGWST